MRLASICNIANHPFVSQFLYSMNVWNLIHSKPRLEILQKTEAQRRHLINLVSAKSTIDTHTTSKSKFHITSHLKQKKINQDNQGMAKRILKINNSHPSFNASSGFNSLSYNLRTYSSLNRSIRLKEIEDENSRMYSRLMMTSPTLKREQWVKRSIQTSKYKQNLHGNKFMKPDYWREACKMIARQPKFKSNHSTVE